MIKRNILRMIIISAVVIPGFFFLCDLNGIQTGGRVEMSSLKHPVRVIRDEHAMAYLYGENMYDIIKAQGYVTAQDRLFQMILIRESIKGNLSEYLGEKVLRKDIVNRTLGFYRAACRHERILNENSRKLLKAYADGVNEYIMNGKDTHHLELKLTGIKTTPWKITDTLAILYYMGWGSAANIQAEITAQMLMDNVAYEKFMSLSPLNINFDCSADKAHKNNTAKGKLSNDSLLVHLGEASFDSIRFGSNNWAVGSEKSTGNFPILVNDPHLPTSLLPALFYPVGLFADGIRAVGVTVPGIPGLMVGRNEYVSAGITNSYGDAQDLYIETVDPGNSANYMEGTVSIPFETIEQTLKVKDDASESGFRNVPLTIRLTRRGPVVSGIIDGIDSDKVATVRWSPMESMMPDLGIDYLLKAQSVDDMKACLKNTTMIHLNVVFADVSGGIGWQTTGRIPIRSHGSGRVPFQVEDSRDNWTAWIPYDAMPSSYHPRKGWIGTANHKTVGDDYPYYYSSWFAPSYRYRRMAELLDTPEIKTPDDHWSFMRDDMNLLAKEISPIIAGVLTRNSDTRELGEILSQWDFRDKINSSAPTVFHETYRNLARMVFQDELGKEQASFLLGNMYYWQERLNRMIMEGHSEWFDDITTSNKTETLAELIHQAGLSTRKKFSEKIGRDPHTWLWGNLHTIEFLNPVRRKGVGKTWLGGGAYPMAGSGDTIYRALFSLGRDGYDIKYSAALRMVADMSDHEKVIAVLPGGVSGRTFSSHLTDQISPYMSGEKRYWWFSDKLIKKHAVSEMVLMNI